MTKPLVALVGRPNVGKSTIFNRLVGKRISIVEDYPGVTRDRLYADAEWCGKSFTLVDTGGIEPRSEDVMWKHIRKQAQIAVDLADVIVMVTDGRAGLVADDYEIASLLRTSSKPIILAVNKVDTSSNDAVYEFYALGLGEPIPVSGEQSLGLGDLLDAVTAQFPYNDEDENSDRIKIAIIGKPNAGKSSLTNKILGYERVIVSDIAGTTRDAIDTPFRYQDRDCVLIDTAGIRRKRSIDEQLEQYSVMRALGSVRRADVVILVADATEQLTEQDVRLCGYVNEQGKPCVVVMNKWDLIEKDAYTANEFKKKMDEQLKFMDYRCEFISALTGQRVEKVLISAFASYDNACKRITTGLLNDVLLDAVAVNEPPTHKGKKLKIYYCSQVSTNPPTFALFVNDKDIVHFSYLRYLENCIRKSFDFKGTPIRIFVRNKNDNA